MDCCCRERIEELEQRMNHLERALAASLHLRANETAKTRTDGLTGVLTRREFESLVDVLDGQFSVLMIDADHFKLVNDLAGHRAGDECLRRIGKVLRQVSRPYDLVARYGGEEFVVVLMGCGIEAAERWAERFQEALACEGIPHPAHGRVTASLGLASSAGGRQFLDVLSRADEALYRAKEGGRNRWAA